MNPVAEIIRAVVEILAWLGFKNEGVVVVFPLVVTEFALLFFASLLETGAILRGVQYLVQAAIRISSTVSIDEGDAGEELWSNNRVLACVLFLIQVEEKTKLIEMLAICAGEHFELPQELSIVLLGQVFAPIFLLFFHLIKLLHSTPHPTHHQSFHPPN